MLLAEREETRTGSGAFIVDEARAQIGVRALACRAILEGDRSGGAADRESTAMVILMIYLAKR
jgi:hypothetical protein